MPDRETILPLSVGLIVALAIHFSVPTLVAVRLQDARQQPAQPVVDLAVTSINTPPAARIDRTLTVEWSIANEGGAATTTGWHDTIYLSRDRIIDEDDLLLTSVPNVKTLSPGEQYDTRVDGLRVNASWIGRAFVIVAADAAQAVDASAQTGNNTMFAPIWIEPSEPPALEAAAMDAPAQAIALGTMQIGYTVANSGPGIAWQQWRDRVYLSKDEAISDDDLLFSDLPRRRPLIAGESYEGVTRERLIPQRFLGNAYVLLEVDPAGNVPTRGDASGGSAAGLRLLAQPIEIRQLDKPDLQVARIEVAERIIVEQATPIGFFIINRGSATAGKSDEQAQWLDRIVLSLDDTLSADDVELVAAPNVQPLDAAQGYMNASLTIELPPIEQDEAWLFVETDTDNHIDEGPFGQNNTRKVRIRVQHEPDEESIIGRIDPPYEMTAAWISHEDYRELLARESRVTQPALQATVDPVEDAPPIVDATPPAAPNPPGAEAAVRPPNASVSELSEDMMLPPAADAATQARQEPLPSLARSDRLPEAEPGEGGELPQPMPEGLPREAQQVTPDPAEGDTPPTNPSTQPAETDAPSENETDSEPEQPTEQPMPVEQPGEQPSENPVEQPKETDTEDQPKPEKSDQPAKPAETQAPAEPGQGGKPTSAPRDDRESPPVKLAGTHNVVPGNVLTLRGLEIKTVVPRISAIARASTLPTASNPVAVLTFDEKGDVIDVELQRTSGSDNIDAPVVASLYKWKARGKTIDELKGELKIEIRVLLRGE